jgi:hypothetical protein
MALGHHYREKGAKSWCFDEFSVKGLEKSCNRLFR